jgi:predicted alpha/beta-hydrolase family hydrolase
MGTGQAGTPPTSTVIGIADWQCSGQAARRVWAVAAEQRAPWGLGHVQAIERATDRWAGLAESLGQRLVAGGVSTGRRAASLCCKEWRRDLKADICAAGSRLPP